MPSVRRPEGPPAAQGARAPRLRVGLALAVVALLLGARPASAATPTLRNLCPRAWRAGDVVRTLERDWRATQVLLVDGPSALPPGVLPATTDSEQFDAVERCLEVGPGGARASDVDVSLQAARDGDITWRSPPAVFHLKVDGERASPTPSEDGYPAPLIDRVNDQFTGHPVLDDPVPGLLQGIVVAGADSAGPLTRAMLPSQSTLLLAEYDPESFRGRWWVERLTDAEVLIAYEFSTLRRNPRFNEVLSKAEWLTGGEWRTRGLLALRRDARLPESRSVWQAETCGCVSIEGRILAVRESMGRDTWVYAGGDPRRTKPSSLPAAGAPAVAPPDPETEARCISVSGAAGGRTVRAGCGVLLEPDVVLTVAHLLLPEVERLTCAGSGGRSSDVVGVSFPKPRSDWVLLRLKEPVSGALPRLATCALEELASHPRAPCVIAAMSSSGDFRPVEGTVHRVSRSAQAFFVQGTTEAGDSGAGVFAGKGRLLGLVTAGTDSGSCWGPLVAVDADLRVDPAANWIPLAQWRTAVPAAARSALLAEERGDAGRSEDPEIADVWERAGRDVPGAAALASRWFSWRGRVRAMRGDVPAGRADLARASALDASEAWLRQSLATIGCAEALAAWVSGDTATARGQSQAESAFEPSDPQAAWRLARSLHDANDVTWKAVVRRLAEESVPSHARSTIGDWIVLSRDPDLAELWAAAAEREVDGMGSGLALWLRADRAIGQGDYAGAKRLLSAAAHAGQVDLRVTGLAAWLLLREKKYAEANQLCSKLDLYEANSGHLAAAFYVADALQDTDLAWQRLRMGLARYPWDSDLLTYAVSFKAPLHLSPDPRFAAIREYMATFHR